MADRFALSEVNLDTVQLRLSPPTNMTPVEVTGFNRDLVIGKTTARRHPGAFSERQQKRQRHDPGGDASQQVLPGLFGKKGIMGIGIVVDADRNG